MWTRYMLTSEGKYALFVLDTNGELLKSSEQVEKYFEKLKNSTDFLGTDEELLKKYIDSNEFIYKNNSGYGRWLGEDKGVTAEEKEEANELLEKYNISLVKIPVTNAITDNEDAPGIAWSAYEADISGGYVWQDVEINGNSHTAMRNVINRYVSKNGSTIQFKVGLNGVYTITQMTDAQRGITNSKIKYLFKNKKYYKYDGTVERAYEIYNDWQACINDIGLKDNFRLNPGEVLKQLGQDTIKQFFRPTLFSYWNTAKDISDQLENLQETALNAYIDAVYYQADSDTVLKLKAFVR